MVTPMTTANPKRHDGDGHHLAVVPLRLREGQRVIVSEPTCVLSIDPGSSSGAICVNSPTMPSPDILRLNKATDRDVADFIRKWASSCRVAVLEKVGAMPGQGVSSTFKFGMSYGGLRMALAWSGIPWVEVSPVKWQGQLGCRSGGDKNVTKRKAQELFPDLKVIHHTADALLLSHWGEMYAVVPKRAGK